LRRTLMTWITIGIKTNRIRFFGTAMSRVRLRKGLKNSAPVMRLGRECILNSWLDSAIPIRRALEELALPLQTDAARKLSK
jgi:hypothetical protein